MSRSKQTSKGRGRRRVVTALGVAGALSLAGGASASISPARDIPTQNTAPVILAEEEISDVSLATFYVFDNENAGTFRRRIKLAQGCGGCGCGFGCGGGGDGGGGTYSGAAPFGSYVTPPRYSKPTRKRRAGA